MDYFPWKNVMSFGPPIVALLSLVAVQHNIDFSYNWVNKHAIVHNIADIFFKKNYVSRFISWQNKANKYLYICMSEVDLQKTL